MARPSAKMSRDLEESLVSAGSDASLPIIVRYREGRRITRHADRIVEGVTESYNYRLRPFAHMHATPEAIRFLEDDPDIVRIYRDQPVYALVDSAGEHIRVPRLWQEELTGKGVRIAIVDSGVDAEHPDLQGRVTQLSDFTGEGAEDLNGHGTHCASIAAGSGAASDGQYRGAAYEASLYSAKVLDARGQGMMSDVAAGVEWAVAQGVQIISLSLGGPGSSDGTDILSETCDAAVEQGLVVCTAAGNSGPGTYTIGSPGAARNVITVGACDESGNVASFSSRGPTADGRLKPDVIAPGVEIVAARAQGTSLGTVVDDYYTLLNGTSMATPMVAGLCALLLQAEPTLDPAGVKERLMQTAVDLGETAYAQGGGRVDAWKAYQNEVNETPTPTPPPPETGEPSTGEGCLVAMVKMLLGMRS